MQAIQLNPLISSLSFGSANSSKKVDIHLDTQGGIQVDVICRKLQSWTVLQLAEV